MEHICTKDDSSGPHPTANPAAPVTQADLFLSTSNGSEIDAEYPTGPTIPPSTPNPNKLPQRSGPLFQGFERPSFSRITILTVLCLITYPAFYILKFVAKDKSLFAVRSIVSVWCSGVGFALGYMLLKIGAQHIEAATWATVIHTSREGCGMKLRDLARGSRNPTSFMPAFHIFRSRFGDRETSRRSRKSYDKRPWSLFLCFFVVLAILAPLLPFLFGRIMDIKTFVSNQSNVYSEVLIAGDLTEKDVNRSKKYGQYFLSEIPEFDTAEFVYGGDTVYFAQPSLSQFVPGGSGPGAFSQSTSNGPNDTPSEALRFTGRNATDRNTGAVLRHAQWGIRSHCEKLPDPKVNLIPSVGGNDTSVFVPRNFLRGMFGMYGMDLPAEFAKNIPNGTYGLAPSNIDMSTIADVMQAPDNGKTVSLSYVPAEEDYGVWTIVETVLVRLNDQLGNPGSAVRQFPVWSPNSEEDILGYDAAVCMLRYEPWIIETYNTSITPPSVLRIVGKGNSSTPTRPNGGIQGDPIANTRYLNGTGKYTAFWMANDMAITAGQSLDLVYIASPTVVSFTNGTEPYGYTELSPDRVAVVRARAGAARVLPYLAGSGPLVAQSYTDVTLAYVAYKPWQLIALPALVLILGTLGELFVPTLPLNVPRREFGVYSWLVLFQSQELRFEAADDLNKFMSLDELEESFSDKRVKFVVEKGEV